MRRFLCAMVPLAFACTPDAPLGQVAAGGNSRDTWVVQSITSRDAHLDPALQAEKHCKMARSPYRFLRGTAWLHWNDFADDPRLAWYGGDDTYTWVQGDLHADNFGAFDNDEGEVVYDLNDFDEGALADHQLDVWRLATAVVLVARAGGVLSDGEQQSALDALTESYLDTLDDYVGNDDEVGAQLTEDEAYGRLDEFLDDVEDDNSRQEMLEKWTAFGPYGRVLDLGNEDLEPVTWDEERALRYAFEGYPDSLSGPLQGDLEYFAVKSVARRVHAGTGSLGTPRFYVLIEGASAAWEDDRILDVKRQGEPAPWPYLAPELVDRLYVAFGSHAERVAAAQWALATDVDDHLGWVSLHDGSYSVRERSPYKESFDTGELDSLTRMEKLAAQWGMLAATAHARADRDWNDFLVPHSLERGVSERADGDHEGYRALVREVAFANADQVEADHAAFAEYVEQAWSCD